MSAQPAMQEPADTRRDDLELAVAVTSGDTRSLRALFDSYADLLFAFLRHRMEGSRADVEDAWQETLAAAVRGMGTYRGESSLFTWLCSIGRRKAADAARRAGRQVLEAPATPPVPRLDAEPFEADVVEQAQTRSRVVEVLARLSADQRIVLVGRHVHRRKVPDLAREIGRSYKATESLLSRAREAFRAAWEGREHEEE
jgi:RNA polymerase sigma-70 factor (ECF subfamily)